MELADLFGISVTLLLLGGLVMTQLDGGIGTWLLVSFVGIPGFFMLVAFMSNSPHLFFGAAVMLGLYTFSRR